ncbi:MAG: hypothetical protein K0R26_1024 [Bacteroidota bacterium]|jgi:hypothetical protein|nr:hypothetical protein [Bacteroidota bacterium]
MKTHTTLYRKQERGTAFWQASILDKNSVTITWGWVGASLGSRVKSFASYEQAIDFYHSFTSRIRGAFSYHPETSFFRVNIRVDGKISIPPTAEQFATFTIPLQVALENELASNGNGSVGNLQIVDHILVIPIEVVNSNLALNRIRETLAGYGIGRNKVLFLPR